MAPPDEHRILEAGSAPSELPKDLNLGCGRRHRPGCLNVDLISEVAPDLVWDLDRRPYPLPRGHFERIWALDVIEHLESVKGFLEEVYELLAPGGTIEITTPHYSCANSFRDPTHRHHLGYFSLDYFTADHQWNFYSPARFEIVERILVFDQGPAARLVSRLANRRPELYEKRFAWIFPAWFLLFKLRAQKAAA
ncbi:MAG TPA: methyltransferase domain-containing protein [Thermoanaerobaculia bacterium]|jgi:SAM-dependent methyltransferase|nr:methyltransferase domain-containing protein [Thermoanaerobaculia bacterium]